jgi:hypothetical protein
MRDTSPGDSFLAPTAHAAPEAPYGASAEGAARAPAADELSDDDLDEVTGGLARAWSERAIARLIHG